MGRTLGMFVFSAALSTFALAQSTTVMTTTTPTPSATTGQPTSGALPLPAPPEAALPGSGTPVGTAPDLSVNNAASGAAGAVVQPGVGDVKIGGVPVVPEPRQVTTPVAAPENTSGAEVITGETTAAPAQNAAGATVPTAPARTANAPARYGAGTPANATRSMSLAEFAAQLKTKKQLTKRNFDNSDIAALNDQAPNGLRSASEDLPQSDQPAPQQAAPKKAPARNNASGVLDQDDLRKVQEALERSKKQQQSNENPK
jgi:hypothetical protein